MLHPVVIETIVRDHQHQLLAAAERSHQSPNRHHAASGLRAWAAWWFAGRTSRGRVEQPTVNDSYLTSALRGTAR